VKVRIGVGLGAASSGDDIAEMVCEMERCGFDSLWLSEVLSTPVLDPLAGLAFAAGTVKKLKLGTTMLVPGRNPMRLAKELATVDRLSAGRLLVVLVPGLTEPAESQAIGVPPRSRGAWLDEVLPLLRRLWTEDSVTHHGALFSFEGASVRPRPRQQPLDLWLGGTAPSALRRAGRIGDGWLPSLLTPREAEAGRRAIEAAAAEAGREVEAEHFGVSLGYARDRISDRQVASIARRRPGVEPSVLVPIGLDGLRQRLREFIDVGFSKFVLRPSDAPEDWRQELRDLAEAVLPLQS
jgi:probable F420-dependent oxidoreductase